MYINTLLTLHKCNRIASIICDTIRNNLQEINTVTNINIKIFFVEIMLEMHYDRETH